MFLKSVVPFLALSIIATPGFAQTSAGQPASPFAQTNPAASLLSAAPNAGGMLSSFLSTANHPTTSEAPDALIQKAQKAYNDKRFKDAMTSLQLAQDSLRRQHMNYYASLLPKAPKGWALENTTSEDTICLGAQIFGGVAASSRSYSSNGHKVKITFVTDAPVMSFIVPIAQSFAPLIANGELTQDVVKGYPSIYVEQKDEEARKTLLPSKQAAVDTTTGKKTSAHILAVLMSDVIVVISSETLDKTFLMQFTNIIDFEKLKVGQ